MQVATGSLESVRPMGVELLDTILDKVSIVVFGSYTSCYPHCYFSPFLLW